MQKESYFTPETIHTKAREVLASVSELRRRHEDIRFHPERAALLVLDMQDYFLDPASHAFIPSATAILPGIRADRGVCRTRPPNHFHPTPQYARRRRHDGEMVARLDPP